MERPEFPTRQNSRLSYEAWVLTVTTLELSELPEVPFHGALRNWYEGNVPFEWAKKYYEELRENYRIEQGFDLAAVRELISSRELMRRVLERWVDFSAAVAALRNAIIAGRPPELLRELSDEIERISHGIGGSP